MLKGKLRRHAASERAPVRGSLNRAMARLSTALTGPQALQLAVADIEEQQQQGDDSGGTQILVEYRDENGWEHFANVRIDDITTTTGAQLYDSIAEQCGLPDRGFELRVKPEGSYLQTTRSVPERIVVCDRTPLKEQGIKGNGETDLVVCLTTIVVSTLAGGEYELRVSPDEATGDTVIAMLRRDMKADGTISEGSEGKEMQLFVKLEEEEGDMGDRVEEDEILSEQGITPLEIMRGVDLCVIMEDRDHNPNTAMTDAEFKRAVKDYAWVQKQADVIATWGGIEKWNVRKVTVMSGAFQGFGGFNRDISGWDTSNLQDATCMFRNASSFNQPLGKWVSPKLTCMVYMFEGAKAFEQDLSAWGNNFGDLHVDTDTEAHSGYHHVQWKKDQRRRIYAKGMFDRADRMNARLTELARWY